MRKVKKGGAQGIFKKRKDARRVRRVSRPSAAAKGGNLGKEMSDERAPQTSNWQGKEQKEFKHKREGAKREKDNCQGKKKGGDTTTNLLGGIKATGSR